MGTEERRQHGPLVVERVPEDMADTKNRDRVRAIEINDPLYRYRRQGQITARERDAGLKLRELWEKAGLDPQIIGAYSEYISAGSIQAFRVVSIDHRERYEAALRLLTPNVKAAVERVIRYQERLGYGQMKHLKHGLKTLKRHFGC